jgi:intein/homing endonuclease
MLKKNENMIVNPCVTGDCSLPISYDSGKTTETKSMVNVISELKENKTIFTLSYNEKTKDNEWKQIVWGDKTRENANILKLELDSGEIIRCTPDHKIYTSNRGYVEAKDLNGEDDILVN